MTAEALGSLLNRLASSEEDYSQFFAFKSQPLSPSFVNMTLLSYVHPNVLCRLCDHVVESRRSIVKSEGMRP